MLDASLVDGWLPAVVLLSAVGCALAQLIRRPSRPYLIALAVGLSSAVLIVAALVFVVDVWLRPFGIPLEFRTWAWILAGWLGGGFAVPGFVRSRPWRKVVAVAAVPLSIAAAVLGVNATYGQYPTVRDALGLTSFPALPERLTRVGGVPLAEWVPPAELPAAGQVFSADIPAPASRFPARPAAIYLPPAALVADPPRLPVLIAMSGQPGSPVDVFTSGRLAAIADEYAAGNGGVAPIVVVPDQLGTESDNPMCVDSPLGNSRTYLEGDVRTWILESLPVSADRTAWVVGGFSQGGTCALQLATGSPELFGGFVDIAGEEGPSLGSPERTLDEGFGGNRREYAAAQPLQYLAGATLEDTVALLVVGELDPVMAPQLRRVEAALEQSGVQTTWITSLGTGHDWATARAGFAAALELFGERMGIP